MTKELHRFGRGLRRTLRVSVAGPGPEPALLGGQCSRNGADRRFGSSQAGFVPSVIYVEKFYPPGREIGTCAPEGLRTFHASRLLVRGWAAGWSRHGNLRPPLEPDGGKGTIGCVVPVTRHQHLGSRAIRPRGGGAAPGRLWSFVAMVRRRSGREVLFSSCSGNGRRSSESFPTRFQTADRWRQLGSPSWRFDDITSYGGTDGFQERKRWPGV
jgi:hypothetical protein